MKPQLKWEHSLCGFLYNTACSLQISPPRKDGLRKQKVWSSIASSTRQNQGWSSSLVSALVNLQEKMANTLQISLVLHNFHALQLSVAESNTLNSISATVWPGCETCRGTSQFRDWDPDPSSLLRAGRHLRTCPSQKHLRKSQCCGK